MFFNMTKGKDDNRVRNKGQGVAWSHEDSLVLLDAYIRSKVINARSGKGYTYWLKNIWDGLGRQARSQPSLVFQVNRIKKGDYLSLEEKEMIEERLRGELNQVNRGGGTKRQVEHNGDESEVESEVDFGAEVGVNRIHEEDESVEVEVVNRGGEVEGGNKNEGGSGKSSKKEERQININNVIVGRVANVVLNWEEVWKLGDVVWALTEAEKDVLAKMKVMMNSNQRLIIPSLKTTNKKEIR